MYEHANYGVDNYVNMKQTNENVYNEEALMKNNKDNEREQKELEDKKILKVSFWSNKEVKMFQLFSSNFNLNNEEGHWSKQDWSDYSRKMNWTSFNFFSTPFSSVIGFKLNQRTATQKRA